MRNAIYSVVFFVFLFTSCTKENNSNTNVPIQNVNITLYPSDPQYATNIGVIGGWVYITGGNKGIIVYRKSSNEFMAYERTCTYDPNTNSRLKVLTDNVTIVDSLCGSKFLMLDGSIIQGPAAAALKAYSCDFNGSVLHIYN